MAIVFNGVSFGFVTIRTTGGCVAGSNS